MLYNAPHCLLGQGDNFACFVDINLDTHTKPRMVANTSSPHPQIARP